LRSILKSKKFDFGIRELSFKGGVNKSTDKILSVVVIDILLYIIGEKNELKRLFEEHANPDETKDQLDEARQKHILVLTHMDQHREQNKDFTTGEFSVMERICKPVEYIESSIFKIEIRPSGMQHSRSGDTYIYAMKNLNHFKLYADGVRILEEQGVIN
ncbi:MAG: hypothetical protein MI810_05445, partial [Flavobacteriales bacterium]|nr:hypothetical protein [Flavobacteriales bacterium]